MFKKQFLQLKIKYLTHTMAQKGQSMIIMAFAFTGLLVMMGLSVDVGLLYIERTKLASALDAAAIAAVSELSFEEHAMTRAKQYIESNGYTGTDIEWLFRGCESSNVQANVGDTTFNNTGFYTVTTDIVGYTYQAAIDHPDWIDGATPRSIFMVDTGTYQNQNITDSCNVTNNVYGSADKVRVAGRVYVQTYFLKFVGRKYVYIEDDATAEMIANRDIVVVFDSSGMMESLTKCYDCWTRTAYDDKEHTYPDRSVGDFNPIPSGIPTSDLCILPPTSSYTDTINTTYNYLSHEAELYSSIFPLNGWTFEQSRVGQGYWAVQRGSRNQLHSIDDNGSGSINEDDYQGNQAGKISNQSSSVCNTGVFTWTNSLGADVCAQGDDNSTYIKANPYTTYINLTVSGETKLVGAAYDLNCFNGGQCWNSIKSYSPPPYVEYDFTPVWSDASTYIWIRAIGGGATAYKWDANSPAALAAWGQAIYWTVDDGTVSQNTDVAAYNGTQSWRDNRADNNSWQWIRLGPTSTTQGISSTLRLYMGSGGYKVDKIVFTNDPETNFNAITALGLNSGKGPVVSYGSATREACNLANPIYGQVVTPSQQSCPIDYREAANFVNGVSTSGTTCSTVLAETNQLQNDLYSGIQPMRMAQTGVMTYLIPNLESPIDQLAFVSFSDNIINRVSNTNGVNSYTRSQLSCLMAAATAGDVTACTNSGTEDAYIDVIQAVQRQWPRYNSNIAIGLKEGLEELGVGVKTNPSNVVDHSCTTTIDDGKVCDRQGVARRILILMTASPPTASPANSDACYAVQGDATYMGDPWVAPAVGSADPAYDCAMYYASLAALNDVVVYTIGLGPGVNTDLMTAMATGMDPTEKRQYFNGAGGQYLDGSSPVLLDAAFRTILGEVYIRLIG